LAALDAFFEQDDDDPMVNSIQTLSEKIRQRRIQMFVHSYLYYEMDENIVDDHKWQQWANELVELQKQKIDIGFYDDAFRDWDGSTGCDLPFDSWVKKRAEKLLHSRRDNL
jgi:hypothetical protein